MKRKNYMIYDKIIKRLLLAAVFLMTTACQNYLTVEPIDRLTGNNFYQSKEDVEANMAFMYAKFFEKIRESWVMGATGEARSGEIQATVNAGDSRTRPLDPAERTVVEVLGANALPIAISSIMFEDYELGKITDWTGYYQVIQSANILLSKLEEGIPGVDGTDQARYTAEAKFIRAFTYFWMVRLYGDVVYYTDPYFSNSLPREPMVSVLDKCIADLEPHKDQMPWTFGDPAERGARPGRGAIIALLMHMHAWNASFDRANSQAHYTEVAELGKELIDSKEHRLYSLTAQNWAEVSKGRTEESLFEFYRSINYGDDQWLSEDWDNFNVRNHYQFWSHFLRWPYLFPRHDKSISAAYFVSEYMNSIYPEGEADLRRDMWFDDIASDNGQFALKKFGYNVFTSGNEQGYPANSIIIFRYSDAILLQAEALAELNRDGEATAAVNLVRSRAEASPYSGGGGNDLKDFIYMERCRELIGEAHRYFDLIRTRRILSAAWTMAPMNLDQYNRRAWTWPLNESARRYNPHIVLNEYWTTTGR
ncbi:RagB/SusD family nutrient uptake outer membrane protein [Sphingobacterium alkalisoli]|uniref:RagB/SusD family nutrient uptake outer membrane protein n=1 Tax=Sphingobacterium alkalisoli TaxID=1874115 RepID=A0A4V5LYZ3_9SPHI|nr:RagB/SusD family nutrient uptake outer membrane protein [Sphingobacterium alkalisoli]TJY68339.1 RagB/SusD family nutrient uptake outer membrane protein [Sphingobacterium alkalisoli]